METTNTIAMLIGLALGSGISASVLTLLPYAVGVWRKRPMTKQQIAATWCVAFLVSLIAVVSVEGWEGKHPHKQAVVPTGNNQAPPHVATSLSQYEVRQVMAQVQRESEEKADAWYAMNKSKVVVTLTNISVYPPGISELGLAVPSSKVVAFTGTIQNLSTDKLAAIVVELSITNSENRLEALKERMLLHVDIFKSIALSGRLVFGSSGSSQINRCVEQLGGKGKAIYNLKLIGAVPEEVADITLIEHFGATDMWWLWENPK